MGSQSISKTNDKNTLINLLSLAIILTPIIIVCVTGYFLRMSADDYSHATLSQSDFFSYSKTFFSVVNGRFSNAYVLFAFYKYTGSLFIQLTPLLYVGLVASTAFLTFMKIFKKHSITANVKLTAAVVASLIALGSLTVPISRYEAYFWLPSFISYGFPFLLTLVLASTCIVTCSKRPGNMYMRTIAFAIVAFLIGGFSELTAAINIFFCGVVILTYFLASHRKTLIYLLYRSYDIIAISVGSLASFLVMYFIPATQNRRLTSQVSHPPLDRIIFLSFEFIGDTLLIPRYALIATFLFMTSLLIAFLFLKNHSDTIPKLNNKLFFIYTSAAVLTPLGTLVTITLISLIGQGGNPPTRAYLPFELALVICSIVLGFLCVWKLLSSSTATKYILRVPLSLIVGSGLLIILLLGIWATLPKITLETMQIVDRSEEFDAQQAIIKSRPLTPDTTLQVQSLPIGDVAAPTSDPKYWVNEVMARYYKVRSVTAY